MTTNGHAISRASRDEQLLESELAGALENYLAAVEEGRPVDLDRLAAEHPAISEQLRACLGVLRLAGRVEGKAEVDGSIVQEDGTGVTQSAILGDFRLVRPIGRGGMGIVYEAEQLSLHRRVALKVLPFAATLDQQQLARFQTEAQAAAQLHHTNIVPVFSVGCQRGVHYYAMQLIEGQTLAALICDLRRLEGLEESGSPAPTTAGPSLADELVCGRLAPDPPPPAASGTGPGAVSERHLSHAPSSAPSTRSRAFFRTVAELGVQAAEALDYAHRRGIIHRDIKPANLLVDLRGNLWITDFGLARMQSDSGLTLTGDVLGTLKYMSPEQALARRGVIDHRTDIYSLGVTLYELLTLRSAFTGRDRQDLLRQLTLDEPRSVRSFNPELPADLETIILKAMAKEPESRYATAKDLADDLRRFLDCKPIKARRPTIKDRLSKWARRHTALVGSAVMMLAVAAIGLGISTALVAAKQSEVVHQRDLARHQGQRARQIVDEMYTRLSERWLIQDPADNELRREFLNKAAQYYEEFGRDAEITPEARLETARAWLRSGEIGWVLRSTPEAEKALHRAIQLFREIAVDSSSNALAARDGKVFALIRLGDVLFVAGRNSEAEPYYRQALAEAQSIAADHPEHLAGRINLASAQVSLADLMDDLLLFHEAEATYRGIIASILEGTAEVRPLVEDLVNYRTVSIFLRPGALARAIEDGLDGKQAILVEIYLQQAFALEHQKNYLEASECLRHALAALRLERYTQAYILSKIAGDLYLMGNYQDSFEASRKSMELVPNEHKTLENLAARLASCPDARFCNPKEAVRLAQKAADLSPQDRDIWRVLGMAHYRSGNWRSAVEAIETSMRLGVSNAFEWLILASAQARLGNMGQARVWYDKAEAWLREHKARDSSVLKLRAEAANVLSLPVPQ